MSIQTPITKPSQLKKPIVWEHRPGIESTQWYKNEAPTPSNEREMQVMQKALEIRDRILPFGGDVICLDLFDPDANKILQRGEFFYGGHAKLKRGEPSRCHQNAANLWYENQGKCSIATGYALSADGIWRQHSWVVQPLTVSWRIWETTEKRIAYFGAILNDAECRDFYDSMS